MYVTSESRRCSSETTTRHVDKQQVIVLKMAARKHMVIAHAQRY